MPMPEQNGGTQHGGTEIGSVPPDAVVEHQQRTRMLLALVVLLLALISVLIKDRQFWFPPSPSTEAETPEQSAPRPVPVPPPKAASPVVPPKSAEPAQARHAQARPKRVVRTEPSTDAQVAAGPVITATNRAVLPPLEVEVVAGNQHRSVSPADSSVNVEMQSAPSAAPEQTTASPAQESAPGTPNFSARVQMSPGMAQVVSRPVDPSYPLLAKQMKVQGAVVLEALISKTGSIQEIQVLSGPAILSAAAREAVKQWHFKPYYQSGQAVETEARITVNFTISTY
jgi:periplasmic protein TonB